MSEIESMNNCVDNYINEINDLQQQLQQLKQDNEKLCTAIRNELPEQYNKRISEAESDIAWGVLDRNATEAEFCKNVIYETRNYIAKLKQENEELKNTINKLGIEHENYDNLIYWQMKEQQDKLNAEIEKLRFPREDIDFAVLTKEEFENYNKLKAENTKLKNIIKEMEEDLDDWISDVSILYTYDDGKPNNLDELQCCMEYIHKEWCKYKATLDEIEEICQNETINLTDSCVNGGRYFEILQLIKQVKEGE